MAKEKSKYAELNCRRLSNMFNHLLIATFSMNKIQIQSPLVLSLLFKTFLFHVHFSLFFGTPLLYKSV